MIAGIVTTACVLAALLVAFLALECLLGAAKWKEDDFVVEAPSFTVLMPAHNEAQGIAKSIRAVAAQLRPCDNIVVIADNCSDDTAGIARSLGATVIERRNLDFVGKGYALEFARANLCEIDAELVIVLDADCIPQSGALMRLAAHSVARDTIVQGAYLLQPPAAASTNVRLSCFAFLIKNLIRQRALRRLADTALLQGSGMAFPRRVFDRIEWSAASLVEDMETGLDLLLFGERISFDDTAVILSDASSEAGTVGQRRRWEHGMLHAMVVHVPDILAHAIFGRWRLGFVALDLLIPPTVLLICGALLALAAGVAVIGMTLPVGFLAGALSLLAVGLILAWRAEGREMLPWRDLRRIPSYVIWKLPIVAGFLIQRETRWNRTERNHD